LSAVGIGLIVAAFFSLAASLSGGSFDWVGFAPALVVVAVYLAIAYALARRSRLAFVVAMLLHAWTAVGMAAIIVTGNYLTQTTVPYAIGVPALAGIIGLVLSWRWYWHRHEAPAVDNHC
jgi:hypothetical protein